MSSATYRSGLHVVSLRFGASAGKGNNVGAPPTGAPLRVSTWEFCCFAREREASEGKLKPYVGSEFPLDRFRPAGSLMPFGAFQSRSQGSFQAHGGTQGQCPPSRVRAHPLEIPGEVIGKSGS